jgi:signal transduction histidine kinase
MKLLTKTTLYIATLSLFLFFIMGIIFFQVLKNMSLSDLNREMEDLQEVLEGYMARDFENLPERIPGLDSISIKPAVGSDSEDRVFVDTVMIDSRTDSYRTYRFLQYPYRHDGADYQIKLFKSTTPADQLVERVTLMMTVMVILFLAGIFFMNRFVFANLWKDFFFALEKLKKFETIKEPVELGEPDIEEFVELKSVLEKMTSRLASDYRELKEYTDHTTHELQTPLAVIKSKTELLLQSGRLGPEEMQLIQAIISSTNHLSRLNTTLTLITRIENQQFTGQEEIKLNELLEEHLEMLHELMDLHRISVERSGFNGESKVTMDRGLADILLTNLLRNAVVHNREGGKIIVQLEDHMLTIKNEGEPLTFDEKELFRRFVRDTKKTGNFGLGLSLVKKICDAYGFDISYSYSQSMHVFRVQMNQ